MSVGATIGRMDDSIESIIDRADKLMYKAKESGKNKISID